MTSKTKAKPPEQVAAKPEPAQGPVLPKAPPWWKTLRADPPAHTRTLLGLGFISLILLLWWFVTRGDEINVYFDGRRGELLLSLKASTARIVSASKIPSPGDVFGSFGSLLDRELGRNLGDTLQRVLSGVALAAIVGVSAGIVAASHRGVNAAIAPLVIFLRSVPMGALIPLTMLLFGDGEGQKTKFIFLAIVGFVFSDTVKAISIVPERYVETAQTLGASRFQIIRKVLVPLAIPDIVTSLRFQFGLALGYIMLAEEINAEYGIGKLIMGSQRVGPYEHMYLLLFVIALIAFTIDLVLRTLQRGIFPWRRDL
ncbi:MAG: cmpB [Deltaproteobacteria bacterium]|nr:cmpB [Deltaproteobacteria bacterium]